MKRLWRFSQTVRSKPATRWLRNQCIHQLFIAVTKRLRQADCIKESSFLWFRGLESQSTAQPQENPTGLGFSEGKLDGRVPRWQGFHIQHGKRQGENMSVSTNLWILYVPSFLPVSYHFFSFPLPWSCQDSMVGTPLCRTNPTTSLLKGLALNTIFD